jgi:RNA polymerase sigma-70 factor, ECF subfamily
VGGLEADSELAAALRLGSAAALESLYDRYSRLAYGLAYRIMNDSAAAEDVVQEAFVNAWRNANAYDPGRGSLRSWLLAIVRNRAIDRLRGSRLRVAEAPLEGGEPEAESADVSDLVSAQAEGREIRDGVAALPEAQRRTLELAYFGGLTHVEIALRMGVPLGTVKGRMRIGLERLRRYLEARGIEP